MNNNLFVLSESQSIANQFLSELRDAVLQKDRMRFRKNLERLGEILGYEVSKKLSYQKQTIRTPLGEISTSTVREYPVLITILRAGIPFHQGFLNVFDHADSGFVGAYRNEDKGEVTISIDYVSLPDVDGKPVVLIDPMLATGRSVLNAQKVLQTKGTPSHLYIVSVVAAPEGIRLLNENLTLPYSLWTCAVDEKLNSSFYIVPGLGDAGDLSYGTRV
ncbi:MAG TPA: uracil phosphoribosyltransferase [Chryseosolibacter sp.]|jgi:Uracil phosphoribosyltransferase